MKNQILLALYKWETRIVYLINGNYYILNSKNEVIRVNAEDLEIIG